MRQFQKNQRFKSDVLGRLVFAGIADADRVVVEGRVGERVGKVAKKRGERGKRHKLVGVVVVVFQEEEG